MNQNRNKIIVQTCGLGKPKERCSCYYSPEECGEDSFFIYRQDYYKTSGIGVADGVGGWRLFNIDSGIFARQLMFNACDKIADLINQSDQSLILDPNEIMIHAYNKMKDNNEVYVGSSTYCTMTFNYIISDTAEYGQLIAKTTNLGDSGYIIIRGNTIIFQSNLQRHHESGTPKQLSIIPEEFLKLSNDFIRTSITEAEHNEHILQENDIILMATDGFWDNINDMNDLIDVIVELVSQNLTLPNITEYLIDYIMNQYKKYDDITIIFGKVTQ